MSGNLNYICLCITFKFTLLVLLLRKVLLREQKFPVQCSRGTREVDHSAPVW